MSLKADPEWWKHLFDDVYLVTDSRSVCNEDLTRKEVDMLESLLELEPSRTILDLCGGQGRHACELYRRGFTNVTVVDYSECLVRRGSRIAESEGLGVNFVQADARNTTLPSRQFDVAVVMTNSFGYFHDASDDRKLLEEAHRLLTASGKLLLDLLDSEFVRQSFQPRSWHEIDEEILVCRERELDDELVTCREIVVSKKSGLVREQIYCVRLYSPEEITELLQSAGFRSVVTLKGFSPHDRPGDYGFLTNRLIVIADKAD
jgi:D-alanine-D-alanine ligase